MANFYTRKGDQGYTGLLGDERVPKYHPRMEAVGNIDETSASLGVVRANTKDERVFQIILEIQRDLYLIMTEVAATPENAPKFRKIGSQKVDWLESKTDLISALVQIPQEFILPGDSINGAFLAISRTITRRAERCVAKLIHEGEIENLELLRYVNRLSSLLFVLELLENASAGKNDPTLAKGK
jgi:cob(I)alamin adenosyltransferase